MLALYIIFTIIKLILVILIFYFTGKFLLITLTFMLYKRPWHTPYVPTPIRYVREGFKMLDVKPGEKVVDLGCGDGVFLIQGAKNVKATFTGYELTWLLYLIASLKKIFVPKKGKVEVYRKNFLNEDFKKFDKYFIFGMPTQIRFILPKLEKEMKHDAKLLSVMFPIDAKFMKLVKQGGDGKYKLFLYERAK